MYRFQALSQILSQQFELVHLGQERIVFVALHMLYGAMFCFFSIIVLLESIGGWLIDFHMEIEFSEAGRMSQ